MVEGKSVEPDRPGFEGHSPGGWGTLGTQRHLSGFANQEVRMILTCSSWGHSKNLKAVAWGKCLVSSKFTAGPYQMLLSYVDKGSRMIL